MIMRDAINLFSRPSKTERPIAVESPSDPTQIRVGGWLAPQPADLFFWPLCAGPLCPS